MTLEEMKADIERHFGARVGALEDKVNNQMRGMLEALRPLVAFVGRADLNPSLRQPDSAIIAISASGAIVGSHHLTMGHLRAIVEFAGRLERGLGPKQPPEEVKT